MPKIIRQDNNRVDLIFEVDEGVIKIQSIRFLHSAFLIMPCARLFPAVSSGGGHVGSTDKYDPGRLDYDVRLLRQFYQGADMPILMRAQGGLLSDRSGFAVTFSLKEGRVTVYRISALTRRLNRLMSASCAILFSWKKETGMMCALLKKNTKYHQ